MDFLPKTELLIIITCCCLSLQRLIPVSLCKINRLGNLFFLVNFVISGHLFFSSHPNLEYFNSYTDPCLFGVVYRMLLCSQLTLNSSITC